MDKETPKKWAQFFFILAVWGHNIHSITDLHEIKKDKSYKIKKFLYFISKKC